MSVVESVPGMETPEPILKQLTPLSKKRTYDGEPAEQWQRASAGIKEDTHSPALDSRSRAASPALSTTTTGLTDLGSTPAHSPRVVETQTTAAKKRKLTVLDKEVESSTKKREKEEHGRLKAQEKEERERQRAEERARRDEEKRKKGEEKEHARRAKELEKESKRRAKEAEKQEREAEKARREAEILKKERSQMRIGAFFGRPAPASTPPSTPDDASDGALTRRSSITSIGDMSEAVMPIQDSKPTNPEFTSWILPFFRAEHVKLAPFNRFHSAPAQPLLSEIQQGTGSAAGEATHSTVEPITAKFPPRRRCLPKIRPVRDVVERMHGASDEPIDLTKDGGSGCVTTTIDVPYKYLFFSEDVRWPYQGTYTRVVSPRSARKISRNPTFRGLPDTNYDYDSEAEWQPPEEGDDDCDDDEKSEDEDGGADDLEDFLDDENDTGGGKKRQILVADMVPKCSGLCYEGEGCDVPRDGFDLRSFRMDVLHDSTQFPINPYSTAYWSEKDSSSTTAKSQWKAKLDATHLSAMQPPRLPLATVNAPNGVAGPALSVDPRLQAVLAKNENGVGVIKQRGRPADSNKLTKMIATDLLPAFKEAVAGSALTKTGLIEVLKKQFPKCSKDAIKDTLTAIAVRQGAKEAEKKWVLIA